MAALVAALYMVGVAPFSFKWKAIYGDSKMPNGFDIVGVDVSHHQGRIDWEQVAGADVDGTEVTFAIVKATEGTSIVDERYAENFSEAKKHHLIRGAYHYYTTMAGAREQAQWFIENVRLEEGDLPPVLDVEEKPNGETKEDWQREVLTWLHIVEDKYHAKPILYTYRNMKEKLLDSEKFDDYPFWIAHYYVDTLNYKGTWNFWQHTDRGKVRGIKGHVDINIYNGSYYDLQQMTIKSRENQ